MTTTDERQALADFAAENGWSRRDVERVDNYSRGDWRLRVIWRGTDAISGGAEYQEDILMTYTRDLATIRKWLQR